MRWYPVVIFAVASLAAAPSTSPVTCRYRVDLRGEMNQIQVSHAGVTHDKTPITTVALLTVRFADTTDGRIMDVSLDSFHVTRRDGGEMPDIGNGRGVSWHGVLAPDNRVTSLTGVGVGRDTRAIDRFVRFMVPRVKPGAKVGDSWVDSSQWTTDRNGETGSDQVVTTYKAERRERRDGGDLLVVSASWAGSRTGTMPAGPDQLSIEGTSTGRALYYVAGNACAPGGWRAGSRTESTMGPPFPEPLTITNPDSGVVTLLP